ncbi:MAG: hypothetical protein EPN84_05275 [Legionella sp.]|nr:MAG: hypothetical protein EPN84_05275 [Legionella sp.]
MNTKNENSNLLPSTRSTQSFPSVLIRESFFEAKLNIFNTDLELAALHRINVVFNEYYNSMGADLDQYALTFDIQHEKVKLQKFLNSEMMQDSFKLWEKGVGIYWYTSEGEVLPENIVCIKLTKDLDGLPEYLKISLVGPNGSSFEIDIPGTAEQMTFIKANHGYYKKLEIINKEAHSIADKLHGGSNQNRLKLLSEFNSKWEGEFTMSYFIDCAPPIGTCSIKNSNGDTVLELSTNNITIHAVSSYVRPLIIDASPQTDNLLTI